MNNLRIAPDHSVPTVAACCRCGVARQAWDRIARKPYCPGCQEALALGESEPLKERTEKRQCAACRATGTVSYVTFPLHRPEAVEMDLCPEHLRCLLGRRLGPQAFHQLARQLRAVGVEAGEVFLLHDAFYDSWGRALQPAVEHD